MLATFRKFGLDHHDFATMMANVSLLLRILTINIYNNVKHRFRVIFYVITTISALCYIYAYVISMIWMVLVRYGSEDIQSSIIVLAMTSCNITCLTKFFYMKTHANEIKTIVEKFLQCDARVIPSTRFAKNLKRNLRVVKKRASIIWVCLMSDGVMYLTIPFLIPGRQFTTPIYLLYGLEPMLETPNYEISMLILVISIGFAIYAMLSGAIYVIVVVGYTEAQMQALSDEVQNIWNDSNNFYDHIKNRVSIETNAEYNKERIINKFIEVRLRDIIQFHITNINLLRELDHDLRPTLALEYSIITFSIIAGLLSGLENTYLQLPYTFVQIFIYCFVGQQLIDACNNFENSLFSSKWELFDVNNQKTVLLMLMMSQKTLMLSAGGVAKLNFNCLMIILKSTYSAYTTLKSVVK